MTFWCRGSVPSWIDVRRLNEALSLKKFEIGTSVAFAGFEVGQKGVFPQRDKAQGISNFATPNNVTELRCFLGMVNQMNAFYPYISR